MSEDFYTNLVSCVCLMLVAVMMAVLLPPRFHGDGWEYTLVTEALINHQTPDVRVEDIDEHVTNSAMGNQLFEMLKGHILKDEQPRNGLGFFRGENGRYTSWHFWLYSLTNVPAKLVLKKLDMKTDRHFQYTNALYLCFLLPYLLLYSRQDIVYKHAVLLLTLLCGGMYYFCFTNPEIFIAVLLILAFTAMLDGRYVQGMVFAAFVGWQNTAFAPAIGLIGIFDLLHRYRLTRELGYRRVIRRAVPVYVSLFVLVSVPFVFNWFTFGQLTPLGDAVNFAYIGLPRLHSLFLDLSQGMIVGYGPVLVAVPLLALFRLGAGLKKRSFSLDDLIESRAHILLIAPFVFAIPLLTNVNWNSGMVYVMRYAFMAGIPFLIWISREWVQVGRYLRATTAVPCITLLAMWNFYPAVIEEGVDRTNNNKFPVQARLVLSRFPEWYNPDPQIFLKRMNMKAEQQPIQFLNRNGDVTKVLIRPDRLKDKLYVRRWDGERIGPEDGVRITDPLLGEWIYLSGPLLEGFGWGDAADLRRGGRQSGILYDNWNMNSKDVRMWTTAEDPDAEIRLHVLPTTEDHTLYIELENKWGQPLKVDVLIDQRDAASWVLAPKLQSTYEAPIDPALTEDGKLNIILRSRSQMESETVITSGVIAAHALWTKPTETEAEESVDGEDVVTVESDSVEPSVIEEAVESQSSADEDETETTEAGEVSESEPLQADESQSEDP